MSTEIELQILEAVTFGNYKEANKLIYGLTPEEISTFSPENLDSIMYELTYDIAYGLGVLNVDAPTLTLRNFTYTLSSVLTPNSVTNSLLLLATQIDYTNSSDYRAIDAITDNMTDALKAETGTYYGETVITSISQNIVDGFMLNNSILVDKSNAALRDFMTKFGSILVATQVEDALMLLSNTIRYEAEGDYRAIDAITDNMTVSARAELSDDVKTSIIQNYSSVMLGGMSGSSSLEVVDQANIALRDFMSKFGSSIKAQSVEGILVEFAHIGDLRNSADYRGIDAITDYLTVEAKAGISVSAKTEIVTRLSNNVIDGTVLGDDNLHDQSVNALNDFTSKFSATLTIDIVGESVHRLIDMHDPQGLSAIIDNVNSNLLENIKVTYAADLAEENFVIYTNTSNDITDGNGSKVIFAMAGDDLVHAGAGDDTILGGRGNDALYGDNGHDQLYGGLGNDTLRGGVGNDFLTGDLGNDTLYGGSGADTFYFDVLKSGDTIKDFNVSEDDKLDLSKLLEMFDPLTQVITDFVTSTTVNNITTLSVDVDGTSGSANYIEVVKLENVTNLDILDLYNNGQIIA